MNRIKKILALSHILPWTGAMLILIWCVLIENEPLRPKGHLIGLYVFYSHLFIFKKYLNKGKYKAYFSHLIGVFLTGPLPYVLFAFLYQDKISTWVDFGTHYVFNLGVVLFFIFLSALVVITHNLIINTVKKEQLEKQAVETELVYLKSQINPHFLFNTLNNIHTLVYKQAPSAPEAVMRLSSLMRYMIYESNASTVPLSIEIKYLQDYIGLQQLRYKKAPVVDLQVEGDTESCHIAPLLFIHLLENAYKHSPARLEPGDVKISVALEKNTLSFSIQNPIGRNADNALEEPGGIGLPNVQKRLQLLYPEQHSLKIYRTDELFTVKLRIHNLKTQVHERKAQLLYN